ncbi:ribonuclease P [Candidatus Woesearchaeota archaeon]|nr:ribonuclease P [Candidatus Woesearchaeota archaeon]
MTQQTNNQQRKPKRRSRKYQRKPDDNLRIARAHINSLFGQAKEVASKDHALADRYVELARKIAMKFKLRIPSEQKRLFCPHCYRFLIPGKDVRIRVHESRIIYYCSFCKRFWRKPLNSRKKPVKAV